MDSSSGFGSTPCDWTLISNSLSLRLPYSVKLATECKSLTHYAKGTQSPLTRLLLFVCMRFQVLFHSPPGVLFTVPSQYYSLSVIRWYLGLEGGPPIFPRNSTCSAVLWILLAPIPFRLPDSHRLWCAFPCTSASSWNTHYSPKPQKYFYFWFSLLRFRSPLLTESRLISFPRPT